MKDDSTSKSTEERKREGENHMKETCDVFIYYFFVSLLQIICKTDEIKLGVDYGEYTSRVLDNFFVGEN